MDRSSVIKSYIKKSKAENEPLKAIYESQGKETGELLDGAENILNQFYVDSATWGLEAWEQFAGVPTNKTKPEEYRRNVIKSKLLGRGTATKSYIKEMALNFENGQIEIKEDFEKPIMIIEFINKGIPPNFDDFDNAIKEIMPAHLPFEYLITFNTWQSNHKFSWGTLKAHTWQDVLQGDINQHLTNEQLALFTQEQLESFYFDYDYTDKLWFVIGGVNTWADAKGQTWEELTRKGD